MSGIYPDKGPAEQVRLADFQSNHHYAPYGPEGHELSGPTGREWRPGKFRRLPVTSIFCLAIIVATGAGSIAVLLNSDGKDRASWGTGRSFDANLSQGTETTHHWNVSVNALLAIFVFIAGRALTVLFAEAVAVSWWTGALQGQSVKSLNFRWEVGQSILSVFLKPRLFNWVCVGALAATIFSGLEALLQNASSSTTALSQSAVNMTATLASALPDGFSGVFAASGHDHASLSYLTPAFVDIIQDYTSKSDIELAVEGCTNASTVSCTTTLRGVGFSYSCGTDRSSMPAESLSAGSEDQPSGTVFGVSVAFSVWAINLTTSWKDKPYYYDNEIINENCTLTPALVEYPVNVSQGIVTLQPSTSEINWAGNAAPVDSLTQPVDKVISLLKLTSWEKQLLPYVSSGDLDTQMMTLAVPGYRSVLGGMSLAFSDLFTSSITFEPDPTYGPGVSRSGSFAAGYALFGSELNSQTYGNLTFASPMPRLIANIREIMFRSSVAIVERKIGDWATNSSGYPYMSTNVPQQATTSLGAYQVWHTVYKTNRSTLATAIVLMTLMVLTILPLYWGYWHFGRDISMSPFEIAKAMHTASFVGPTGLAPPPHGGGGVLDVRTSDAQSRDVVAAAAYGSNYNVKELVRLLGHRRVKYGEISSGVLGMGSAAETTAPIRGAIYI